LEFVVDTGSFYRYLSPAICDRLGLFMPLTERIRTADDRSLEVPLGIAHIEIDGREGGIIVGALNVREPLLGVSALESLGFKVNPVEGTLEPTRPFPESPVMRFLDP